MKSYKISVGSAQDYEDLIADILFPGKFGVIISQEREPGAYYVSFHSFNSGAADDFDFTKYDEESCVALDELMSAISEAKSELDSQLKLTTKQIGDED